MITVGRGRVSGDPATPLAFGALIDRFDWPGAFLVAAVATAGLALAWTASTAALPGADPADTGRPPRRAHVATPWMALLADRSLILLTLSYAAVGYFQYLFFYWMEFYFQTELGLPESRSRTFAAIPALAMAVGMPLGGWLSDRLERSSDRTWVRRLVPMAGMSAGSALLVLGVLARDPAWIVGWFALALGAVEMAEGPFCATAIELGGRRGGSSAALFNTGGNAGGMLAPVVTPWVGLHFGWGAAVGLGAIVCLAGVLLWIGVIQAECEREVRASP
jgi:MFS family permease